MCELGSVMGVVALLELRHNSIIARFDVQCVVSDELLSQFWLRSGITQAVGNK
jgi:hypothetical protein